MLYVTGCLEEAGIILVRTAFDEDVAETLIIFIDDINLPYLAGSVFEKSLDSSQSAKVGNFSVSMIIHSSITFSFVSAVVYSTR